MFKNLTLFRYACPRPMNASVLSVKFDAQAFVPTEPSQQQSIGWVPPRGEANGVLVESVGDHLIARLMIETRAVPAEIVERELAKAKLAIEQATGRKPGKKQSKELKEEIILTLLPKAFPKQKSAWVWIDPVAGTLAVEGNVIDHVMHLLLQADADFSAQPLQTLEAPASCMAHWLQTQEPPQHFSVDRACELKAQDESRAVVRYGNHSLDLTEIQEHIGSGKMPTRLAMTWYGLLSFTLTDALVLKGLEFLDVPGDSPVDAFEADALIATSNLRAMLPDLVEALGGAVVLTTEPAGAEE